MRARMRARMMIINTHQANCGKLKKYAAHSVSNRALNMPLTANNKTKSPVMPAQAGIEASHSKYREFYPTSPFSFYFWP